MQCSECRWWLSIFRSTYIGVTDRGERIVEEGQCDTGECRRFPPKRAANGIDDSRFPVTHRTRWCGEFTEKKGDQNEGK